MKKVFIINLVLSTILILTSCGTAVLNEQSIDSSTKQSSSIKKKDSCIEQVSIQNTSTSEIVKNETASTAT